ncbi:hypothetical protein BJX70DRAFT_396181 [Aspergillus crustosus]
MTTSIANQPATPLEPPPPYTLVQTLEQDSTISTTCITSWLSRWLWSNQTTGTSSSETSANPSSQHNLISTDVETRFDASGQPPESAFPCRGCRVWRVECDRRKPHCSHCLDQQILCFYVEPLRVTMKRSKQAKAMQASSAREGAVAS